MHCPTPYITIPRCLCGVLCEYAGISNVLFNTPTTKHTQVTLWGAGGTITCASLHNGLTVACALQQ